MLYQAQIYVLTAHIQSHKTATDTDRYVGLDPQFTSCLQNYKIFSKLIHK